MVVTALLFILKMLNLFPYWWFTKGKGPWELGPDILTFKRRLHCVFLKFGWSLRLNFLTSKTTWIKASLPGNTKGDFLELALWQTGSMTNKVRCDLHCAILRVTTFGEGSQQELLSSCNRNLISCRTLELEDQAEVCLWRGWSLCILYGNVAASRGLALYNMMECFCQKGVSEGCVRVGTLKLMIS